MVAIEEVYSSVALILTLGVSRVSVFFYGMAFILGFVMFHNLMLLVYRTDDDFIPYIIILQL